MHQQSMALSPEQVSAPFCSAEALFADIGHFNRQSIQIGMLFIVYPALLLTYLGQAAYLLKHPENVRSAATRRQT